jgi:hypothetical protein
MLELRTYLALQQFKIIGIILKFDKLKKKKKKKKNSSNFMFEVGERKQEIYITI